MKRFLMLGALGLAILLGGEANAQSQTFANFFQSTGNATPFTVTNDGANTVSFTVVPSSLDIVFRPVAGTDFLNNAAAGGMLIDSVLTITQPIESSTPGGNATFVEQPFPSGEFTISAAADVPALDIVMGDTLLKATFSENAGLVSGATGAFSSGFSASEDNIAATAGPTVTFMSMSEGGGTALFDFSSPLIDEENLAIALTGMTSALGLSANGLLSSFQASGTGQFAATIVPEPATVALLGLGLVGVPGAALALRRRKARA